MRLLHNIGYLYLALVFLGLAYTFLNASHIRINIVTSRLDKKKNKVIDIIVASITFCLFLFIFYRTALFTYDSYSLDMLSEAVSQTPLYLTQLVMPLGSLLFALSSISFIFKRLKND